MIDHLRFVGIERKLVQDQPVPLDHLCCRKPERKPRALRVILDDVLHRVDRPVDRAAVVVLAAEILPLRMLLILRDVDGMGDKLAHALVLRRGDGNDGHSQHRLHPVDVDGAVVADNLVHHVERDDHRNIHLQKLHGQVKVTLDIGCVDDIDDRAGLVLQDEAPGDNLLAAVRGHGIDPWQVRDPRVGMALDRAVLAVHRDAGEVADMLVGSGQLVEERRLAAVLVADQGKGEHRPVGEALAVPRKMIAPVLTEARVLGGGNPVNPSVLVSALRDRLDPDGLRVSKPERQLIPVDLQFHRIPHRREFHHCDLRTGNHAHIQEVLP